MQKTLRRPHLKVFQKETSEEVVRWTWWGWGSLCVLNQEIQGPQVNPRLEEELANSAVRWWVFGWFTPRTWWRLPLWFEAHGHPKRPSRKCLRHRGLGRYRRKRTCSWPIYPDETDEALVGQFDGSKFQLHERFRWDLSKWCSSGQEKLLLSKTQIWRQLASR